ncbi:hypothetical protein ACFQO7_34935 [Catellatospora aurea]|uniref:TetR family transcriptional regulator n=1 Tax=Catellatospora aurea TaxID=1337874 RepID=A0ABW2H8R2_9ACTN
MIGTYLRAEQEIGRITADADPDTLAAMLIGSAHLLYADRTGTPPDTAAVRKVVDGVLAAVSADRRGGRR